jgi:tetratricopeptide (TPR) repeat protein
LAISDWDQDGDLDVWLTNRTAPSLQFFRNDLGAGRFVAFKLIGKTCNRDAIGASLEVVTESAKPRLIRSLKAGEGYLSQSSKWLHFGLPEGTVIRHVVVKWPGGASEQFKNISAENRYRLEQGSGRAVPWTPPVRTIALKAGAAKIPPHSSAGRIVPHARLPMPRLPYVDQNRKSAVLDPDKGRSTVVNLWATWCQPCLVELSAWAREKERLATAGIRVLCLATDAPDDAIDGRMAIIKPVADKLGLPFETGLASSALLEHLDAVQRVLISRKSPLSLPCSVLLDSEGNLAAFYRGTVSVAQLTSDARVLTRTTRQNHRTHAVPLPGRQYVIPAPPDLAAIPAKLLDLSAAEAAFDYLERHISPEILKSDPALASILTPGKIAGLYSRAGAELAKRSRLGDAEGALRKAWQYDRSQSTAANALAQLLHSIGRSEDAVAQYREILEIHEGDLTAMNNLAWILATDPSDSIKSPREAITIAEKFCDATANQSAGPLDTLAAAYAAAGEFERAVQIAENALALLRALPGNEALASPIELRLAGYREGKAYTEGSPKTK